MGLESTHTTPGECFMYPSALCKKMEMEGQLETVWDTECIYI